MALSQTSLSAAITAAQLTLPVSSTAAFPAVGSVGFRQIVQIDAEFMLAVGVPVSGQIVVAMRGYDGTVAAAHDILSPVVTSTLASDFGVPTPSTVVTTNPSSDLLVTIGQDGAIAVPMQNTIVQITKASALAATLAAPSIAENGLVLVLTSQTAFAHVVTATSLFADAVTGAPHTTATFAAFKGASLTLIAENGLWNVKAAVGVVIT